MKIITIRFIKIAIIFLTIFSSFYVFYEYDNYKHQYDSLVFRYNEGLLENFENTEKLFHNETESYLIIINRFEQLSYLNITVVVLLLIFFFLTRKPR
jgi:hypothetical protein